MSKALPIILLLSLLTSCAHRADNEDVTMTPDSEQTIDVNDQNQSFVKKVSMSIKKSLSDKPTVKESPAVKANSVVTINVDKVNFAFDSYELSSDAISELSSVATALQKDSKASIVITGHCDARGTKDYNLILGEKRAIAVKSFLVKKDISASRIQTISYGEEKPLKLGNTESDYQANRRAELTIK